jgi:hypothetical protein
MKLNEVTNITIMKKMNRERNQVINTDRNAKRLSKKKQKQKQSALTYSSTIVLVLVLLLLLDPSISVSAMGLLSTTTKTVVHNGRRHHRRHCYHPHQLYYKSQHGEEDKDEEQQQFRAPSNDDDDDNNTVEKVSKNRENDSIKSIVTTTKTNNKNNNESKSESSELMIIQEQAAKLRMEAESLQLALQETRNQKLDREIEKVDQWIDDLFLIQQESESEESTTNEDDNNVDILKNVDQVYQYMTDKRFSAEQIYKIFNRLSDIKMERSQGLTCESRSNCSPFMSLLLDAANKLDCTEKEDNPNKRWNYKIERILQKKLFARDWNIEYIADDEPEQQRRLK